MEDDSAHTFNCAEPDRHKLVVLCRPCDRGNRYCSRECAARAGRRSLWAAGKRYQSTVKGRQHHAARQAAYARRQAEKLTHQGSPPAGVSLTVLPESATTEIYPEWAEWPEDDLPREEPEGRYETWYRWPDAGWISPVKAARLIVKWLSFFYSDPWRRYDAVLRSERMKRQRELEASSERAKTEDFDSEEAQ